MAEEVSAVDSAASSSSTAATESASTSEQTSSASETSNTSDESIFTQANKTENNATNPIEAGDSANEANSEDGENKSIFEQIGDFFSGIANTIKEGVRSLFGMDEKIGDSSQHQTGDCYLLSGVNALSYTEEGAKAIQDVIEYQDNGDITLHFKGGYGDYTVTRDEVTEARYNQIEAQKNGESVKYSTGDIDMLALELGVEKAYNDLAYAKSMLSEDDIKSGLYENGNGLRNDIKEKDSSIWGGWETQVMNMITGKETEFTTDSDTIKNEIDNFDNTDKALGCSWNPAKDEEGNTILDEEGKAVAPVVKDINGKDVTLVGGHAYAIKNTTDNTVTVTNPWNSGEDITISKDDFMKNVNNFYKCDMSDSNPDASYVTQSDYDVYGRNAFLKDFDSNIGDFLGNQNDVKQIEYQYDSDGDLIQMSFKDENGDYVSSTRYTTDKEGNRREQYSSIYSKDGKESISEVRGSDGSVIDYKIANLDDKGCEDYSISLGNDIENARNIYNRDLMSYDQFSINQIRELSKLSDADWHTVERYINNHPDATYSDIIYDTNVGLNYPSYGYSM